MAHVIERVSILAYSILSELEISLRGTEPDNDIVLGILMGFGLFLDEKVGPIRAQKLMKSTPGIVLKTDANVTINQVNAFIPVVRCFGDHLSKLPLKQEKPDGF